MKNGESDPFAIFTAPPPNETPEERCMRERREVEAKQISDRIDEEIKAEKAALKRQKALVKVLLLGQSESGKSTTIKNFRMKYARAAWKAERLSWRAVIQLNLIRSIITIVDALQAEADNLPLAPLPAPLPVGEDYTLPRRSMDSEYIDTDADSTVQTPMLLTDKHRLLSLRLRPLRTVEGDLKRTLGDGAEEIVDTGNDMLEQVPIPRAREFGVRRWKNVFEGTLTAFNGQSHANDGRNPSVPSANTVDDVTEIISSCREDMNALWEDDTVKAVLKKRRIRLEESAGFFLDDLDRIATRNYEPSDNDIVRARLRTVGVQEYRIQFDQTPTSFLSGFGGDFGQEWIIYDVGGSRTVRNAWIPYFESVNAIIFLAPISCFDERLLEDPTVNRLEDSFLLWKAVCGSKILAKTTIILFLNKCDLLKRKLKNGAQVKKFLPSYGERPNESNAMIKYLKEKFKDTLRQESPEHRMSYFYATSVTDTKATATTLKTVRDSILREHLKNADFV